MTLNKQAFEIAGVTVDDYKKWCKEVKKPAYKPSTKEDFFARIQDGRLVKDASGKLVKKYRRK